MKTPFSSLRLLQKCSSASWRTPLFVASQARLTDAVGQASKLNFSIQALSSSKAVIMLNPEILSRVIKKHRKAAGLSQLQLAEMAGVGKTVVFDLEKGKETIQLDTLRKILTVLNIKVVLQSHLMNQIMNTDENS